MRTEADLREALAARAELAPGPDPVLAGVDGAVERRRRRTTVTVVAATIAVAAAITVPALVTRGGPEAVDPADPAAPPPMFEPADLGWEPFSFMINHGTVAGLELAPLAAAPEYQFAELTPVGEEKPAAGLSIYAPDASVEVDWDVTQNPTPTQVGDAPAWFSTQAGRVSALRWEYAPGAYAVLSSPTGDITNPSMTEDAMREVAEAIEFVAPYSVTVPYRLDYLPAGMTPFNVVQELGDDPSSTIQFESGDGVMDISIGEEFLGSDGWNWQDTTVAGHEARCADIVDGRRCEVELDGVTVSIGSGSVTDQEFAQIVAGMTLATIEDPSTWYELEDALPTT